MRILALDHGSKRIGVALSDELKMIAQPLEFIPAEPFAKVLARLAELIRDKQVELVSSGCRGTWMAPSAPPRSACRTLSPR